jgi:hypothetical protein
LILEYLFSFCTCIDISGSQYTSLVLAPNPSFYIGNFVEIRQEEEVGKYECMEEIDNDHEEVETFFTDEMTHKK